MRRGEPALTGPGGRVRGFSRHHVRSAGGRSGLVEPENRWRCAMGVRSVTWARVLVVGALALVAATAWAGGAVDTPRAPIRFEIEGRYFFVDDVTATSLVNGAVLGTPVDLVADAGLDGEDTYDLRFNVRTGDVSRLRFGFGRLDLTGSGTTAQPIYWQGAMFQAGDVVGSTLRQQYYRAEWVVQFVNIGDGVFRLGPILGVHVWKARARLSSDAIPEGVRETFNNLGSCPRPGHRLPAAPGHRHLPRGIGLRPGGSRLAPRRGGRCAVVFRQEHRRLGRVPVPRVQRRGHLEPELRAMEGPGTVRGTQRQVLKRRARLIEWRPARRAGLLAFGRVGPAATRPRRGATG